MKEKLKNYKLVGVPMGDQNKSVAVGKLKQKGLAHNAYWSMGKSYYKGLKKEFDAQLKKMESQDKHKYKDSRGRWDYAHHKVIKLYENKKSKSVV